MPYPSPDLYPDTELFPEAVGWSIIIDPASEANGNYPLNINDADAIKASEPVVFDAPPLDGRRAESVDTEGALPVLNRYGNREIAVPFVIQGAIQTRLAHLMRKVAKLNRECGTLQLTTPTGSTVIWDVVGASVRNPYDHLQVLSRRGVGEVVFECRPFGRGIPVHLTDNSETDDPCLVFTVEEVLGDAPGLGVLTVDEDDEENQWFAQWGIQSRYFDPELPTDQALFYEAEALTPTSTAAGTALSGASGGTVVRQSLTTTYQSMLSTRLTAGSAHLAHVGAYRVWGRLFRGTATLGTVSVGLEWSCGDFRKFTTNTPAIFEPTDRLASFVHTDLGVVNLEPVEMGEQQWEGRIIAKSTTVGDVLDVDCLYLFPITEGYGEARAVGSQPTLTSYVARDEFAQAAGALTGETLPVGGTWTVVTSSDADDFQNTGTDVDRTAVSDSTLNAGRFVSAGTTNYAATSVSVDVGVSLPLATPGSHRLGVFARLTDIDNWLAAVIAVKAGAFGVMELKVYKRKAGVLFLLGTATGSLYSGSTVRLDVQTSGEWAASNWVAGGDDPGDLLSGFDADLAAGGTLATGKVGLYDAYTDATAWTRTYDNFIAYAAQADAAVFSDQSLQFRSESCIREDSTGSLWTPVSDYRGDYLLIPPAGLEGRSSRVIVKASRGLPETGADSGIDDISAQLSYTPRYLQLPE